MITYSADAEVSSQWAGLVLTFEPFTFVPDSAYTDICWVESVDRRLVTRMEIKNAPDRSELDSIALEIHEIVLRRLMLTYDCSFSDTLTSITNRRRCSAEGMMIDCSVGTASASGGRATIRQGISDISSLRSMLESPLTKRDRWARILHRVEQSGDPIVEFLGCYLILAAHHNDSQDKIDAFIKANEPSVKLAIRDQNPSGKAKLRNETVYRRLRNELMHVFDFNEPRDPREIYAEVKMYRPGIARLARTFISQLD